MKKNHLFLKYLLINLCLLITISVGCLVNVFYTYDVEKNNIIKQNEVTLERSINNLEELLNSIYSISSALRSNTSLQTLSRYKGDEMSMDLYVLGNYFKKDLRDIQMIANISANAFVLFRDNPMFVSNTQVSDNFEEYYGTYFEAEGKTESEFREDIFACDDFITCKTYPKMKIFDSGLRTLVNPLVIVVRIRESNNLTLFTKTMVFAFVIDQNEIFKKLFSGSAAENLICICDNHGNILNTFGENASELLDYIKEDKSEIIHVGEKEYYLLQETDDVNGNHVLLAIPASQVKMQTFHLLKVNFVVLIMSVLISVAAIVVFSYQKSLSMQEVINHINKHLKTEFVSGNEYKFIQNNVEALADSRESYQKELNVLQKQMEKNLVEQMFLQEMLSKKAMKRCEELLPFEIKYYYVVVLQCQTEDMEVLLGSFYITDKYLDQYITEKYLCVQTAVNELSILIDRNDSMCINKEEAMFLKAFQQRLTEETKEVFQIGISGIGMGYSNIHTCYIQARQAAAAYKREYVNTIGYYSELVNESGEKMVTIDYLSKIYQYIVCGKKDLFEESINKLIRHYKLNPYMYEVDAEGIYYSICQTLSCAATELSISEETLNLKKWNDRIGFEQGMLELKKAASRLFTNNELNKKSHNDTLKEQIVEYIEANFCNPNLTTTVVCQEMKISEKYLIQFLKEQTGKTFSKYLEELRVEKAKELLSTTEDSNEKIAKDAGFGSLSSFYRVFNKRTGVSPAAFRKNKNV